MYYSYKLQARRCWATGTSDPDDPMHYEFITDFCGDPDELHTYQTLEIYSNGISNAVEISLESFGFSEQDESDLYLHCEVRICDPAVENCEPVCSGGRRRRSQIDSVTAQMAIGPIRVRK